jgi:hypothetical protein
MLAGLPLCRRILHLGLRIALLLGPLCAVALALQLLMGAPLTPSPSRGAQILLGLCGPALALALPVAALFGAASAAEEWRGGEWSALAISGRPARSLLPALLLCGTALGLIQGLLNHLAEPAGRRLVRERLMGAAAELRPVPGQALTMGPWLMVAGQASATGLQDIFLSRESLLIGASAGTIEGSALGLQSGSVRALEGDWELTFAEARLSLVPPARRTESAERSSPQLAELIDRMRLAGKDPRREQLSLWRRSALPLCLPLLVALGVALGARGPRPAWITLGVTLAWWSLTRACDQALPNIGPGPAAAVPPAALALAALIGWARWREA